jgi:hypothetical protein
MKSVSLIRSLDIRPISAAGARKPRPSNRMSASRLAAGWWSEPISLSRGMPGHWDRERYGQTARSYPRRIEFNLFIVLVKNRLKKDCG